MTDKPEEQVTFMMGETKVTVPLSQALTLGYKAPAPKPKPASKTTTKKPAETKTTTE